ncbi:MAG: extracellular solute-binding protein [Roseitalea sp.]|jgi:multiple sugar transport system substrate-binding protein|nr:extracellular solute-binding protein [Roseitalea sp.]MBO6722114.1 extracellular solute-binding protein [Roseitalea sp.]MBO6741734.1 extracellular solute-binding protein [Roseitalea sp.]
MTKAPKTKSSPADLNGKTQARPGEAGKDIGKLTEHELSRIVTFLKAMRAPFDDIVPGARHDAYWNIVLELAASYVSQRPLDQSSLIAASGASYGTGNRIVSRMIGDGLIRKVPRGPRHKTAFLEPSDELLDEFVRYAVEVKSLLARTFGLRSGGETEEYYFGGSYFASHIIAPLSGGDIDVDALRNIRFLLNDDNYFASMRDMWSDFRTDFGRRSSFDLRRLPELYDQAQAAFHQPDAGYDVVAINMPWLGRFASEGLLADLGEVLEGAAINPLDFHPSVWGTGRWNGRQYGIPIYCTIEILTARRDLFEDAGLRFPATCEQLLDAADVLHRPDQGQYGIVWNGARGMPIAHSFMFMLASHGSSVIDIPRRGENWTDTFDAANLVLNINSEAGLEVVDYMQRLVACSPPDIAEIDWNQRIDYFISGRAAMAYCWTMRAARFEHELASKVKRKVEYLPPPARSERASTAPVGGFLLTIPATHTLERQKQIIDAIAWMASPEAMKAHVKNGFPVAPRFSVCADPEALSSSPIVRFVDRLARHQKLNTWSRPPVPGYMEIERVLGEEIHDAVFHGKKPRTALADAEARILGGIHGSASHTQRETSNRRRA